MRRLRSRSQCAAVCFASGAVVFVVRLAASSVFREPALILSDQLRAPPGGTGHVARPAGSGVAAPEIPELSERVLLVTGSTDGIGKLTATRLAKSGCTVLVHGRKPEKVARTVDDLRRWSPNVHGFVADLSLVSEVRRLGKEISSQFPVLHGLLNNAGTFAGDYTGSRTVTEEGNEYSLAVNVLAPFLLTSLLLDSLRASGAGRVLITSSISAGSNELLSDLQCEEGWSDHRAYSLSKLCDAMMAQELHRRYGDPPRLSFHTMDPGTVNTKMLRAGWGSGGIPVEKATTSYEMLVGDEHQRASGTGLEYCRGEEEASRRLLWAELENLTGALYPSE